MGLAKKFYALENITYYYRVANKTRYTEERKVIDLYKGLRDCLFISKSMNLYNLYYLILCRLNENIIINLAKKFIKSNNLKSIISEIINNIDYNFLEKNKLKYIKSNFYKQLY